MTEETKIKVRRLSQIVESDAAFVSKGLARLKITEGGQPVAIEVPIKSTGLDEYRKALADKAPRPPVVFELFRKGSPEAKELGVNADVKVARFDTTDQAYVDANDAYFKEMAWRLAVFAIDCPLIMADGRPAETYEEKRRVLAAQGITGHHLDRIAEAVQDLSRFSAEQEDFLFKS